MTDDSAERYLPEGIQADNYRDYAERAGGVFVAGMDFRSLERVFRRGAVEEAKHGQRSA